MKILSAVLLSAIILPAHAGIVIYGTRVIYPAEKKEVVVQLVNQGEQKLRWYSPGLMTVTLHYRQKNSGAIYADAASGARCR